jgi:hypothetical protein
MGVDLYLDRGFKSFAETSDVHHEIVLRRPGDSRAVLNTPEWDEIDVDFDIRGI